MKKLFLMCCFANDVCLQWVLTWGIAAAILWMITYVYLDRLLVELSIYTGMAGFDVL